MPTIVSPASWHGFSSANVSGIAGNGVIWLGIWRPGLRWRIDSCGKLSGGWGARHHELVATAAKLGRCRGPGSRRPVFRDSGGDARLFGFRDGFRFGGDSALLRRAFHQCRCRLDGALRRGWLARTRGTPRSRSFRVGQSGLWTADLSTATVSPDAALHAARSSRKTPWSKRRGPSCPRYPCREIAPLPGGGTEGDRRKRPEGVPTGSRIERRASHGS